MRLANAITERRVVEIWQNRLTGRTDLLTEEGEPLKIVYPGRTNDDRGADLCDAVIATSRGLIGGDIEVHVKSSSWWAHGHHQDPNYNRVILHVVFWRDSELATTLQNGQEVPTLALHKFIKNPADQSANYIHPSTNRSMPCRSALNRQDTTVIGELLDTAGKERFLIKAAGFQAALAHLEASQSLYQGIMTALGYNRNKHPLMELAQRMPLHRLQSIDYGKLSGEESLAQGQALLLGTAGLLPSQRSRWRGSSQRYDGWVGRLEKVWASYHHSDTMSEDDWHLFKVRPSNLPIRRIVAMSYLLSRYQGKGILEALVGKLGEAPGDTADNGLEKALRVTTDGYWANHLDFGLPSRISMPALIGSGRAADIVVNVLLPFAAAWGRLTLRPVLSQKAFDLYHRYPKLSVNTVERHMINQLGISRYLVNSARRQQGLLHIYKTLCSQGKCHDCPLGDVTD